MSLVLLGVQKKETSKEDSTPSKDEEKVGIVVGHVSKLQIMTIGRTHSAICNRAEIMHSVSAKTHQILLMMITVLLQGLMIHMPHASYHRRWISIQAGLLHT